MNGWMDGCSLTNVGMHMAHVYGVSCARREPGVSNLNFRLYAQRLHGWRRLLYEHLEEHANFEGFLVSHSEVSEGGEWQ